MTVAALTETRVQISGDGVTNSVTIPYQFINQHDLKVIHTDALGKDTIWNYQQEPGSWFYSGGDYDTGTVHFTPTDLISGERLTVVLTSQYDQSLTLDGGEIDPAVLEKGMDKTALQVQAIAGEVSRSLSVSPSLVGDIPNLQVPDLKDGEGFVRQGDELVPAPIESGGIAAAVAAAQAAHVAAEAAKTSAEIALSGAQTARSGAETAQTGANQAKTHAETAQAAAAAFASSAAGAAVAAIAPVSVKADANETAIAALPAAFFADGQSYVSPSLSNGVWYENTTGKSILVSVRALGGGLTADLQISSDGSTAHTSFHNTVISGSNSWISAIVGAGEYYRTTNVNSWREYS